MKRFLLVLAVVMFALSFMCADASANGGVAVAVTRPILFPRLGFRRAAVPVRQAVVVAPQAVVVQPFIRQRFVTPLIVPQAYVAPQAFFQQQFVVPQAFSGGCASSAFFSY